MKIEKISIIFLLFILSTSFKNMDTKGNAENPQVILIYPKGGENIFGKIDIKWITIDDNPNKLNISIKIKKLGDEWETIVNKTKNDGCFTFPTLLLNDGYYIINVSATDENGNVGWNESGIFKIDNIEKPIVVSPKNYSVFSRSPVLIWDAPPDGKYLDFEIYISTDWDFQSGLKIFDSNESYDNFSFNSPVPANSTNLCFKLPSLPSGRYYWKIRAYNSSNAYSKFSAIYCFIIDGMEKQIQLTTWREFYDSILEFPEENNNVSWLSVPGDLRLETVAKEELVNETFDGNLSNWILPKNGIFYINNSTSNPHLEGYSDETAVCLYNMKMPEIYALNVKFKINSSNAIIVFNYVDEWNFMAFIVKNASIEKLFWGAFTIVECIDGKYFTTVFSSPEAQIDPISKDKIYELNLIVDNVANSLRYRFYTEHWNTFSFRFNKTGYVGVAASGGMVKYDDFEVIKLEYSSAGTFVSKVMDGGINLISQYLNIHWDATIPNNTSIRVYSRTGNTTTPDDTWSSWINESNDELIESPLGQYIQLKICLQTSDNLTSPSLHEIAIRYKTNGFRISTSLQWMANKGSNIYYTSNDSIILKNNGEEVCNGKNVNASHNISGCPANFSNDENMSTAWVTNQSKAWIEYDLEKVYDICEILLYSKNIASIVINISKDRINYTTLKNFYSKDAYGGEIHLVFPSIRARYVNLSIEKTDDKNYCGIIECRVYNASYSKGIVSSFAKNKLGAKHSISIPFKYPSNHMVELMKEVNIGWHIIVFDWASIEPTKGNYKWEDCENLVNVFNDANISLVGQICTLPSWISNSSNKWEIPQDENNFTKFIRNFSIFVKKCVENFSSIKVWEIWNEPTGSMYWHPKPNASQYVELLNASYNAIKEIDTNCRVLGGSIPGLNLEFLEAIYENASMKGYDSDYLFDSLSVHYPGMMGLKKYKETLNNHNDSEKEIWITEEGVDTGIDASSENYQAFYYVKENNFISNITYGPMFLLFFKDTAELRNPMHPYRSYGCMGIIDFHGRPKEAFYALKYAENPVLDGGLNFYKWRNISWLADTPQNTSIILQTRTSKDGINWSDWVNYTKPGKIKSPNYRFLQWKAILSTNDSTSTPILHEITIGYDCKAKIFVDDDYNDSIAGWNFTHFNKIQDGINACEENGIVYIYNGTYHENLIVNKSIWLIGEDRDKTIIDYNNDIIEIAADGVFISNFTIRNGISGIKITSSYNKIFNCKIYNNSYGIYIYNSSNNIIYNNYFDNICNAYDNGNNTWNISKMAGKNIIDGIYLGGNYWHDYDGIDTNGDGIGDTMLPYNCNRNISHGGDYLPLVKSPKMDYIIIAFASKNEVFDCNVSTNFTIKLYALAFNYTYGYIGSVNATWLLENYNSNATINASYGKSIIFNSGWNDGIAILQATYNGTNYNITFSINHSLFTFMLYKGWNFITLPCINDYNASSLFSSIKHCQIILLWNASIQDFIIYIPHSPYDFSIENGRGYFTALKNYSIFSIPDIPIESVNITLYEGWNALGYFKEKTNASSLYAKINNSIILLKWNESMQDFMIYIPNAPDFVIRRGNGFMIAVNKKSEWHGEG